VGSNALVNTTGNTNTAIGYTAGQSITGGSFNILLGAGGNITTGSSNILIGNSLSGTTAGNSNQLDIGDGLTASNVGTGPFTLKGGMISGGTTFTITSGCATVSARTGGATAGTFATTTTGACTPVIALPTAPNGWACNASVLNRANVFTQTATTTTSCTVSGTTVSGDTVIFSAIGF
jgi:hypothetical protein